MMLSAVSLLGMGAIEAGTSFNPALSDLTMRQTVYISLGIAVMTGMYFVNFKLLQRASGFIYAAALMAIVASLWLGPELINGNRRYVGFWAYILIWLDTVLIYLLSLWQGYGPAAALC